MPREGMAAIYALIDPLTEEIRYVGMTRKSLAPRLRSHLTVNVGPRNGRTHRIKWIRSLRGKDLQPRITLVQIVPETHWQAAESYWISYFRSLGCPLTNGTNGGDGLTGYTPNDKHRSAIGLAASKRWQNWRESGQRMSEADRASISARNSGRKHSDEERARISAGVKGKPKSAEHRERIRQALFGRKQSPAHREKTVANAIKANHVRWGKET